MRGQRIDGDFSRFFYNKNASFLDAEVETLTNLSKTEERHDYIALIMRGNSTVLFCFCFSRMQVSSSSRGPSRLCMSEMPTCGKIRSGVIN